MIGALVRDGWSQSAAQAAIAAVQADAYTAGLVDGDRYQPFSARIADRLIALGWTRECPHCDPRHEWPCPTIPRCDEPGCEREATCGWPTRPGGTSGNGGYRRTCGEHYRAAKAYREDTDAS
jgi:hypothetical protein